MKNDLFRKILVYGIVLLFFGANIVLNTTVSGTGEEDPIELDFSFSEPIIENITINTTIYDRIIMSELSNSNIPGEPRLPIQPVNVLIPQNYTVEDINVSVEGMTFLNRSYFVEPGQQPYYTSYNWSNHIGPITTSPNATIYNSSEHYPNSTFQSFSIQEKHGYRILRLNIYPVRYIPNSREIYYYTNMNVTVSLTSVEPDYENYRGLIGDENIIEKIVVNPEVTNSYLLGSQTSETYEYVIITSDTFDNAFANLTNWKETRGEYTEYANLSTKIMLLEDIITNSSFWYDGYWGDGGNNTFFNDTQCQIRNFIKMAYNNWSTEYVLIGGDVEIIPYRGFHAYGGSTEDYGIPSDLYYGCLDGNWNDDEDNKWGEDGEDDLFAEVYIGRAPVDSLDEVNNFVNKTIAYENDTSNDESYLKKAVMIGPNIDDVTEGGNAKDLVTEIIPQYTTRKIYNRDGTYNKSAILEEMENGSHLVNYYGHADVSKFNSPDSIESEDVINLSNNEYFLIYSEGCNSASYDENESIGEYFVTVSGGAFAYIGNSRLGWYLIGSTNGPGNRYDRSFFKILMNSNTTNVGKMLQESKEKLLEEDGYTHRWTYYELNLLGDPETQIETNISAPTARLNTVKDLLLSPPVYNEAVTTVNGTAKKGNAENTTFSNYILEYGYGPDPSAWYSAGITLADNGTNEVTDGILGYWGNWQVDDGNYTLRLTVYDNDTLIGRDWIVVEVINPSNVSNTPDTVGFGYNVTISVDGIGNVSTIDVNITYPDDTLEGYPMNHTTGDTYEYVFSDTWQNGQYNYTIWVVDNANNTNISTGHSFNVSANAIISVCTLKDAYGDNETVNLTDPPPGVGSDGESSSDEKWWIYPELQPGQIYAAPTFNWAKYWSVFKKHALWSLEGWNPSSEQWKYCNNSLTVEVTDVGDNGRKLNLVFDAPAPVTTDYRLTLAIDYKVKQYVHNVDKYTYNLSFEVHNESFNVSYNFSDIASIPGVIITHGVKEIDGCDYFWFRARKNNVLPSAHIELDPTYTVFTGTGVYTNYPSQRKLVRQSNDTLWCTFYENSDVHVASSEDAGATWNDIEVCGVQDSRYPSLAVDSNDIVHLIFPSLKNDADDYQLEYTNSSDWTNIVQIRDEDKEHLFPAIAVDSNDNLHVVYEKGEEGPSNDDQVAYINSTDNGGSWGTEQILTAEPDNFDDSWHPSIAINNTDGIHVVFSAEDHYLGKDEILHMRSNDYGGTWSDWEDDLVYQNSTYNQQSPCIAIDDNDVPHVVWVGVDQNGNKNQIGYSYNDSSGWSGVEWVTWDPAINYRAPSVSVNDNDYIHTAFMVPLSMPSSTGLNHSVNDTVSWTMDVALTGNYRSPNLISTQHPTIDGAKTNRPKTGYALICSYATANVTYHASNDLTWGNVAPTQSGEVPANSTTGISLTPQLYVLCTDVNNDNMNATWWWSNNTDSYNTTVMDLNPNFRWVLDGDFTDEMGNLNGTAGEAPNYVDTIIPNSGHAQCGDFVPNDEMHVADDPLINTGVGYEGEERSISVWFNADTIPSNTGNTIWSQGGYVNSLSVYTYNDSGTYYVYCTAVEGGANRDFARAEIVEGTTYHLGGTYDFPNDEIKIYINGVLIDTDDDLAIGVDLNEHIFNIALGGQNQNTKNHDGDPITTNFDGRIADFAYWSGGTVLSEADFLSIYTAGNGTDWFQFASNSSFATNTNITQPFINASAHGTTYWWSVHLTDGACWNNDTYHFTTYVNTTSVDDIIPYCAVSSPLNVTATGGSSFDFDNVTLWYRYSPDNGSSGYEWSYQEDANSVSYPSCGDWDLVYDGDWDTGDGCGDGGRLYGYMNYTKPAGAISANVKAKWWASIGGERHQNYTLSNECFDVDPIQLRWVYDETTNDNYIGMEYYNGSAWNTLFGQGGANFGKTIYEEGIWWNISQWTIWNNASNPDTISPWSWNFDFLDGRGYYEFYSIGKKSGRADESPPVSADAWCHYGNQSKIKNVGSTNISGYLLMQVQFWNETLGDWVVDDDTVNETTSRTINVGEELALDTIFNGNVNTNDLTNGDGTYRVYAAFRDPEGNVLVCDDAVKLEAWWEFEVDTS